MIYIYIHVCCINNWRDVFLKLYDAIKSSGLLDKIKSIKCNVLTHNYDALFFAELDKIEVIGIHDNLDLYETPTINLLHEHALREDFYVLYMHTKGIKSNGTNQNVIDWVNYLTYFNIKKHDNCIKSLAEYDTVGVNLQYGPHYPPHYSGNFWWSKSEYIKRLNKCVYSHYNSPEFWLTEQNIGKYLSLWNSNVNHYLEPYGESNYADKVIDCFIFYNELDLLNYRLNILNEVVDYFVLVESMHTHTGKEKPLYFSENKHLFEKFNDKIIHVIVDDFPYKYPNINILKDEQWKNEQFQRNCIARGLQRIDIKDNDLIIISDLDEIPDPRTLNRIRNGKITVESNSFEMDMYYYNLKTKFNGKWTHSKIVSYKKYNELNVTCTDIRFLEFPNIPGGWHLSYFGDSKFIVNKINNFTHQEYNNKNYTDLSILEYRIKNCKDIYGRNDTCYALIKIELSDNNYLPIDYEKYLGKFY